MNNNLKDLAKDLEQKMMAVAKDNQTIEEAEELAMELCAIEFRLVTEITPLHMDMLQRKNGVKHLRAAIRLEHMSKAGDGKKPTEGHLEALLDSDKLIIDEQKASDEAICEYAEAERLLNAVQNAQIPMRKKAGG